MLNLLEMFGRKRINAPSPTTIPTVTAAPSPLSEIRRWTDRRIQRMVPIFAMQGYSNAQVGKLIRGARHVVVPIRPSLSDIARYSNLHERWLALASNVGKAAGVKSYAEWDVEQIYYFLELPSDYWRSYHLNDLDGDIIGLTEYRKFIRYQFSETYSHTLLAGNPGSGKSVGIEAIGIVLARAYTPEELGMIVIDPHNALGTRPDGEDVGTFENLEHLIMPVAKTPQEIEAAWQWTYNELKHRMENNIRGRDVKRIVIIADELASDLVLGRKGNNHESNLLIAKTLGAEARKFKINLLLGTQKPEEVDKDLFDYLNYRFVGKVSNNPLGSRILGRPGFKLADLNGAGDFFVSADRVHRFQFALPTRADFDALPRAKIPPVEVEVRDIGRIPIVTPPPPSSSDSLRLSISDKSKGGAKFKCADMAKIAYYVYYGLDRVTMDEARLIEALQLSRSTHERHRDEAKTLLDTLRMLEEKNVAFEELPRLAEV